MNGVLCVGIATQTVTVDAAFSQVETSTSQVAASIERVVHLDDLIMRRTLIGILGKLTLPLLKELAAIVAKVPPWPRSSEPFSYSRRLME
jgi:hypothetical protein